MARKIYSLGTRQVTSELWLEAGSEPWEHRCGNRGVVMGRPRRLLDHRCVFQDVFQD